MSDNLVNNQDLSSDSIEHFDSSIPGYYGNISSKVTSFSALNKDKKNLHNSVFSNLVPGVNGTINKHFKKFKNMDQYKINPYFYNEKPGDASKCNMENIRLKQSAAYEYNLSNGECNLYNKNPNEFEDDPNFISGYKINQKFDSSNVSVPQRKNVLRRMGSQYLQNKFKLTNTSKDKDVNKCIKAELGEIEVKMRLVFYVRCKKNWYRGFFAPRGIPYGHDGSRRLSVFFLTYRGRRVSQYIWSNGLNYPRCGWRWWDLTFLMKGTKADGIRMYVGNDKLVLNRIDTSIRFGEFNQYLFTVNCRNISLKRRWKTYGFPRKIDLNAISFSQLPSAEYEGTKENKTLAFPPDKNKALDDILGKDNWSIKVEFIIDEFQRGWRNIFARGNSNYERSPCLWIYPNTSWKLHFRLRTNRSWNSGYDFWIPPKFRKYGTKLTLNIDYIKYSNERTWWRSGFILNVTINGVHVGCGNLSRHTYKNLPNRKFHIKDPWHKKNGYNVEKVTFSTVPLLKVTTGYGRGYYEQSWKFNNMVSKLEAPYYLIRVGYSGYINEYNYIVYKRKTSSKGLDMWKLMHTDWFNERRSVKNKFRVDFDLYSTLDDAIKDRGAWKFCNFNDPGIGFPRDCGINRPKGHQWQSKRRGGKRTWALYLYKGEQDFVDVNLYDAIKQKLKSFSAEADCVYRNLSNPKKNFNETRNALNDNSVGKINPLNDDNELIKGDMQRYRENVNNIDNLSEAVSNTFDDSKTTRRYNHEVKSLRNNYKDEAEPTVDLKQLELAIDGKETFQNYSEFQYQNIDSEMESFENESLSCSSNNKFYSVLIVVIVLLLIIYFLYNN